MIISDDINHIYKEILTRVKNDGELKAKRRESYFVTFTLTNLDKNIIFFPFAQRNWPWILRECSDRIFGVKNPGVSYLYSKNWENRIEDTGLYSYHYSNRLNGQIEKALSKKLHSRDKVIQVWSKEDYDSKSRQPCTLLLQLILEYDNKLSMMVIMRNNDIINLLPSDIFIHSTYLKYWATKYKLEYKNLYWVSAVAYYQKKRDELKFVERLLNEWQRDYNNIDSHRWNYNTISDLEIKEQIEEHARKNLPINDLYSKLKTYYVKEWTKVMLLANYKKSKDIKNFNDITRAHWETEFSLIKDAIVSPK